MSKTRPNQASGGVVADTGTLPIGAETGDADDLVGKDAPIGEP